MEEENQIKLHGMWGSTFTKRVELALKLKGIPYEYIEEDLSNKIITSDGEAQEKATKDLFEKLTVLEEGMKEFFPGGTPSINGENLGLLDVLMCALFGPYRAHEEVLGMKMIDPERNPLLFSWVMAITELPVVKESPLLMRSSWPLFSLSDRMLFSPLWLDHLIMRQMEFVPCAD
ncbi:hypothetical protein PVL29_022411 [Vitis rotundifolia]|uniref:Glutathione S-transferase n=1 Tax=Vitis rotundifolia TaxID=103349 RepID=A0AA38YVS0_VITRO|nr:hypothetical protein PVL29_022411 [Vitis rotundifolia]